MQLNIWLKENAKLYVGGDPTKGTQPLVTTTIQKPQVLVDQEKNTITIIETK